MIIKPSNLALARREFLLNVLPMGTLFCLGCGNLSAWTEDQEAQKVVENTKLSEKDAYELNAIREMYMEWAKAFEAKDADRICSFFADEFVIPYGDGLRDKKWYRKFLIEKISEGAAWKMYLPDRLEVSASGDLAYAVGYYDMVRKAGAKTEKLCGLDVLRKQKNGSWKFVSFR